MGYLDPTRVNSIEMLQQSIETQLGKSNPNFNEVTQNLDRLITTLREKMTSVDAQRIGKMGEKYKQLKQKVDAERSSIDRTFFRIFGSTADRVVKNLDSIATALRDKQASEIPRSQKKVIKPADVEVEHTAEGMKPKG